MIWENLKFILTKKGISIEAFAESLGVDKSTLWRRFNKGNLKVAFLKDVARTLGVEVSELTGETLGVGGQACHNAGTPGDIQDADDTLNSLISQVEGLDVSKFALNMRAAVKSMDGLDPIDKEFLISILKWTLKRAQGEASSLPGEASRGEF